VRPGSGWVSLDLWRTDEQRWAEVSAASLSLSGGERLLVGRDAEARAAFERRLGRALVWALAITAGLALVTGWLLSRLVLGRIAEITRTADTIVSGAMDRRVPLRGTGDEFDRLAGTLNAMLDRIEGLVGEMRMVTDSVAHDLRSPLTRLRGHVEAALETPDDAEARELRLARALEEADHVLRSFTRLLEIARAEAGMGREQFERLDLAAVAADMGELFGPVAEDNGLSLHLDAAPAEVSGHPQLLAQAVSNLMENALAHAPEGSAIALATGTAAGTPWLSVADEGPGVPAADRERVLRRFVRRDESRGGNGTGLGLSLVAAVARMHGATLDLGDNAPGLKVTLTFPGSAGGRISRESG
jgi:signal transduction histidine kinase